MKKTFSLIGMLVGIALIIVGILAMSGSLGDASSYARTSAYDSGFASFGADYYTFSVNNSAEAAAAARAASSNLIAISDFLQTCGGLSLIIFGLMAFCGFGIVFSGCASAETAETEIPEEMIIVPEEEISIGEEVFDAEVESEETASSEESVEEAVAPAEEN